MGSDGGSCRCGTQEVSKDHSLVPPRGRPARGPPGGLASGPRLLYCTRSWALSCPSLSGGLVGSQPPPHPTPWIHQPLLGVGRGRSISVGGGGGKGPHLGLTGPVG